MSTYEETLYLLSKLSDFDRMTIYKMLKEQIENISDFDYQAERILTLEQVHNGEKKLETVDEMMQRLGI